MTYHTSGGQRPLWIISLWLEPAQSWISEAKRRQPRGATWRLREGDRNLLARKAYDWGEDGPISVMRNIARERSADQCWDWASEQPRVQLWITN